MVLNDGYALLRCRDPRGIGVAASLGTGPAVAALIPDGSESAMGFWCQHPRADQASHLVRYTRAIAAEVGLMPDGAPWPLSLGGSVMTSGEPVLRDRVLARVAEWLPSAQPEVIGIPPVLGVLLDAYASLGESRVTAVHRTVLSSTLPPDVFVT